MPNCKNCSKEIPKGLGFCSEDCLREFQSKKASTSKIHVSIGNVEGFILGSGAVARARNIEIIKLWLSQGISPEQILDNLEPYFKPATVQDYIRVALKLLKKG